MKKLFSTFVAALSLLGLRVPAVPAQTVDTVFPIIVDYEAPPPTLDALTKAADAVALVRVVGVRNESQLDPVIGRPRDVTKYDVRVVETLKPHAMLVPNEAILILTRKGGQHAENGKVIRTFERGFEDFQRGAEYVLFLSWNARVNDFDIAYGPDGSYQVPSSGGVRALGQSSVAAAQQGKERGSFLNELRVASAR